MSKEEGMDEQKRGNGCVKRREWINKVEGMDKLGGENG
jgi:hypothetical protein